MANSIQAQYDKVQKNVANAFGTLESDLLTKNAKIKAFRVEASRLAALANKRIARLEANQLTDNPAYKKFIAEDGKFSVRGKSYNDLQKEVSRMRRFIESKTSTIRGTNNVLKEMASNTGISYTNLKDLKTKSSKFFELASKVEQYLRTVDDMASAIGYQKIWEAINQYVDLSEDTMEGGENNIDSMVDVVTKAIKEYEKPVAKLGGDGWFKIV